jgi:glycosyltransferase involved in cell wall biosynthesis
MTPLSVVIITFNEERNIRRCIESVQGIADEIVVVDSFSTDSTETICRTFGVRFLPRAWEGYSPAKNFGNEQARNNLILSLDADEALSPQLSESIAAIKRSGTTSVYKFNRMANYCGKWIRHGGWYPDVKVRIFDRTKTCWTGRIHETLRNIDERTAVHLQGDCLHYSYSSLSDHIAQARRFSEIAAIELRQKGKRSSLLNCAMNPAIKFVRDYIFKLGFLDGKNGLIIAAISAYATYLKYAKLARLRTDGRQVG